LTNRIDRFALMIAWEEMVTMCKEE
jgi:hypothetical protein